LNEKTKYFVFSIEITHSESEHTLENKSNTTSQSETPPVELSPLKSYDHYFDSGKGSSLLNGTSFDVLMNSLKTMREKDLDYLIEQSDDSFVHVTD